MPSEAGGRPASMQSRSPHASTWGAMGPAGDQEARSSICAPSPSAASEPNPLDTVFGRRCRPRRGTRRRGGSARPRATTRRPPRGAGRCRSPARAAPVRTQTMRNGPPHCIRLLRVVEEDEAAGAVGGVAALRIRADASPASAMASGASPRGRGDLLHGEVVAEDDGAHFASAACANAGAAAGDGLRPRGQTRVRHR